MRPSSLASRNDKSMQDRLLVMWTKEEDDILRDQVKVHGIDKYYHHPCPRTYLQEFKSVAGTFRLDMKYEDFRSLNLPWWAKIATHLCGKTSRQCRRRWHMFLNVVNKRGGWSAEEDVLLLEAHRKFGNRWTEIAKKLPGRQEFSFAPHISRHLGAVNPSHCRTDNAVKNRFCVLCKKQTKEVEVSPLRRPRDSRSDNATQRLPERTLLEGTKAILGSGANKKMRTEANLNRKPEVAAQQTPLEETLQQWKGLQCSEVLSCSPHQLAKEGNVQPWDSEESTALLHHNTEENRFQGWMGLTVEGKRMSSATHPQMQLRQTFQQWEGSQPGACNNDPTCSTSSLLLETPPFKVSQSHTMSSSGHSGLMQENLQQSKTATVGDVSSSDCMHHQRMLKRTHSTWCRAKTIVSGKNLGPEHRPDNDVLPWWKGVDRNMTSNIALQQRGIGEALHHWGQNFQNSVTVFHNHQRSIDENLPPLSEMNSLAAVYMSNSKQCTLLSGMQRWSAVQPGKEDEHVQQSTAGGTQTWDHSLAKEANDRTSNTMSKENMNEWQDWNSDEVGNYSPRQDRPLEHTMEIDDPRPDDSSESISFGASGKTLPLWTFPVGSTVLQRPAVDKTQEWNKPETPTKSPRQLLEDRIQQWEKSNAAVHPGPLISMLSRFAGSDYKVTTQLPSTHAQRQGGYKSQLIEDSWKSAVEKLKCLPATFTANAKLQSPRGVLGFEEYMSRGSVDSDLETAAVFPPAVTNPLQTSNADDSKWELPIDTKNGEDGEMNTRAELLPGSSTTCEAEIHVCGKPDDKVKLTTEEEAPRVTESPPPDIQPDGAHSPTQIVPRSHVTMECMPSPQFSDSEKEFLLSTLALGQATTNCWSSSPLPSPFPFSKARNPLFDTRYDTPARSPLSLCLLRQFQVSDAPNQT